MFKIANTVKVIKNTLVSKVSDKKKSFGNNENADTATNPLYDFTSKVSGEGFFPIKEYVDFDEDIDLRKITLGVKEDKSAGLATIDLFQNHSLIGGSAGGGKSILLATLISQVAKTNAIMYGVDFKVTELYLFEDRFAGIAHTQDEALVMLQGVVEEMLNRNLHLKSTGAVRLSIDDPENPPIVVIIDELAELTYPQDSSKEAKDRVAEINKLLETISQLSRSASISLVVATQSPKSETISTRLRNNLGIRIGLYTAAKSQLQAIIGEAAIEVEQTSIEERAGWLVTNVDEPVKFKALWIDDEERRLIARQTKDNNKALKNNAMKKFEAVVWENFINDLVNLSDDGRDKLLHSKNTTNLAQNISVEDGKIIRDYILNSEHYSRIMANHYKGHESLDRFVDDFYSRVDENTK